MLRELAHLKEQLGEKKFKALINSSNTNKVKKFCDDLVKDSLPTEMTVGGRTYEILDFLQGDEKSVPGRTMVYMAKAMNANLGQDDGEHILKYQDEIPATMRGKVVFVFPDWRHASNPEDVYCVYGNGDQWVRSVPRPLDNDHWNGYDRLLRRKYK